MTKEFKHKVKVYYEDTDAGGVVYYANYLKFLERARSEAIYTIGLTNKKLLDENEIIILVKSCNIQYKKPVKFEDELEIVSKVISKSRTSFIMLQKIFINDLEVTEAEVHLVVVSKQGKPTEIPEVLNQLF